MSNISLNNFCFIIPVGYSRTESALQNIKTLQAATAGSPFIYYYNDGNESLYNKIENTKNIVGLNDNKEIEHKSIGSGGSRFYLLEHVKKQYDFIVSVDDDIIFDVNWWQEIKQGIEANPQYDLYTCTVYNTPKRTLLCQGQNIVFVGQNTKRISLKTDQDYLECDTGCGAMKIFTKKLAQKVAFCKDAYTGDDILIDMEIKNTDAKGLCITKAKIYHKPSFDLAPAVPNFRSAEALLDATLRLYRIHKRYMDYVIYMCFPELKSKPEKEILAKLEEMTQGGDNA